jgi:hypothetical protein
MTMDLTFEKGGSLQPSCPKNLLQEHRELFDSYFRRDLPEMEIKKLFGITATHTGLLYKNGRAQMEAFPYYFEPQHPQMAKLTEKLKIRRWRRYLRDFVLSKRVTEKRPAYWCTDTYSPSYYHWVCETLPRIHRALLHDPKARIFLPGSVRANSFVTESLAFFPDGRFEFIDQRHTVRFEELTWVSQMGGAYQFSPGLMKQLRDRFRTQVLSAEGARSPRRIYVSRQKASRRKILNEEEVIACVRNRGFEIVHFEDHSFTEQICLCMSAEIIVGIHGAGLSNTLFMPPGGRLIELQKKNTWASCYFRLCHALGLDYYYLFCSHFPPEEMSEFSTDLNVEISQLERLLDAATRREYPSVDV